MASQKRGEAWRAGLGTTFQHDERGDLVRIVAEDGSEIEVPGPDLRELLETLQPASQLAAESPYDAVFDRARRHLLEAERQVHRDRREAPDALAELLATAPGERERRIETAERFQRPTLVQLAVDRSMGEVHGDLDLALSLADLACTLSQCIDPRKHRAERVRCLQAHSQSVRGNALRVTGDLRAASEAFSLARDYLSLGDPASEEAIEVDLLESSLLRDRRDFSGALALLDRVIAGLADSGQAEKAADAHFRRAIILEEMGESARAIESLATAGSLTEDQPADRLGLSIRHSWVICLAREGRIEEARQILVSARPLYAAFSSPLVDARRLWVEGIVELEANEADKALEPLRGARDAFGQGGYVYDVALVSLDLAAALVGLGKARKAGELAEATYRFMEAQEIHPDALAALAVFRQAALQEALSRELLTSVARRFQRAPTRPPAAS